MSLRASDKILLPSFEEIIEGPLDRCVSWYHVCSYMYYRCNLNFIEDFQYDMLCKRLALGFDLIDHPHKHLLTLESLRAGSGYDIKDDSYPSIVKGAADDMINGRFELQ